MERISTQVGTPSIPLDVNALTASRTRDPRRIEAVATQFESVFGSLLLKEMRATLHEETMFGSDPGDVLGGLFDHFMGEQFAKAGGLGIGNMVRRYLKHSLNNQQGTSDVQRTG